MKEIGVYIHIPFCKQKCYYCDFISYANKENCMEKYINALKKEIENFTKNNEIRISTVYIGGGTPSYIDSKYIGEILNLFKKSNLLENAKEVTIEVNPGTVTEQKLKEYKIFGINRLSIGLQSTENRLLKEIGRIHNYDEFLNTYKLARKVGFKNINVDLMIGLPNQSILDIKKSLEKITNLDTEHISVYSLIVEEETPISKMIENGKLILPSEELERNMYWYVKNLLELKGYKHYEISNFAKVGYESKHNLDCWEQKEYIGFGVAAHSYINDTRFGNICDFDQYIINCENNEFEKNKIIDEEKQSKFEKEQEYMLIGLRKLDGISISNFKDKFGENPVFVFRNGLNKLVDSGLLNIDLDNIKLTSKGLNLANLVWEEFV